MRNRMVAHLTEQLEMATALSEGRPCKATRTVREKGEGLSTCFRIIDLEDPAGIRIKVIRAASFLHEGLMDQVSARQIDWNNIGTNTDCQGALPSKLRSS